METQTFIAFFAPFLRHIRKPATIFLCTFLVLPTLYGQNTRTTGVWSSTTTWQGGVVPGAGSTVNVSHAVTVDGNIAITGGTYNFFANTTDATGGSAYALSMAKSGNIPGTLDIKSGTTIFEGAATVNDAVIYVRSGATLILGGLTSGNNTNIYVEAGGTLIINGNWDDKNNGTGVIFIDGYVQVYGNFTAEAGSIEIGGTGAFETTGSIKTTGSSTVFGSQNDCNTGPCSGASLQCGINGASYSNFVSPSTQSVCAGQVPASLSATTNAPAPTYQWQVSTTSGGAGFTNISGATSATYAPDATYADTWFRVVITTGLCVSTSPSASVDVTGEMPTPADAGTSQVICVAETTVLSANTPTVGTGTWSIASGPDASLSQFGDTANPASAFSPSTAGTYVLRWTISNGSCPASSADVTIGAGTVSSLTWTGNAGTQDWNNAMNWACPQVPDRPQNVFIPAGFNVVVDAPAFANSVTIASGATLTLSNNASLEVAGTFTNNGTVNGGTTATIIVSGDFVNSGVFNAQTGTVSLQGAGAQNIHANNATFNVLEVSKSDGAVTLASPMRLAGLLRVESATAINVDGYLTLLSRGISTDLDGRIGPLPAGASVNGNVTAQRHMDALGSNVFRYVASPVKNAARPADLTNLYRYTPKGWVKHTGTMTTGQGFATSTVNSQITWSATGEIHTGSMTWTFPNDGWYLVGNPYPSAIRWSNDPAAWTIDLTKVSTTIAVTDNSVTGYPNYFRYYQYDSTDPTTWGTGPLQNGVVAMGQALWVYSLAGGSLTIHENAKIGENTPGEFYRSKTTRVPDVLGIAIANGETMDQTYIQLAKGASPRFELKHDLPKLWNHTMNVYLLDEGQREMLRHSIENIPAEARIFIGVQVSEAGEYQLSFDNAGNFSLADALHLVDRYEGIALPVSAAQSYSFTVGDASKPVNDRFYLTLRPGDIQRVEQPLQVYPNPFKDRLTLRSPDDLPATADIYNQHGQRIQVITFSGETTLDMHDRVEGLYVVKIRTERGVEVRKVVKE